MSLNRWTCAEWVRDIEAYSNRTHAPVRSVISVALCLNGFSAPQIGKSEARRAQRGARSGEGTFSRDARDRAIPPLRCEINT